MQAFVALMRRGTELTYAAAGVQERTVYRHFPKEEGLQSGLWARAVQHLTHAQFARFDAGAQGVTKDCDGRVPAAFSAS